MEAAPVKLNADLAQPALVRFVAGRWVPSPAPGVHRWPIERDGGEVARATSIVRYEAGGRFAMHAHDLGEEFLVLDGVFSDEAGHHGPGSYVRNPPGSRHAPYSDTGCVIFVKLRQMPPVRVPRVVVAPESRRWGNAAPGVRWAPLHEDRHELVFLARLDAGGVLPARPAAVEEVLVLEGSVDLDDGSEHDLGPWTWLRRPGNTRPAIRAREAATLWIKCARTSGAA